LVREKSSSGQALQIKESPTAVVTATCFYGFLSLVEYQATLALWALQSQPDKLPFSVPFRPDGADKKQNTNDKPTENGGARSGGKESPKEHGQKYTGGNRRQPYGISDTGWNDTAPYPPLRVDLLR
jgi:hypothetical protein